MKKEIDELNEKMKHITSFNSSIQKSIAIEMWKYVSDHLDELHDMLTDEEIDSAEDDYGYDALDKIKEDFCYEFERETGVDINWDNHCILCTKYSEYGLCSRCTACPLRDCSSHSENPYHTLVEYAFHNESRNAALSAVYKIISVIEREEF